MSDTFISSLMVATGMFFLGFLCCAMLLLLVASDSRKKINQWEPSFPEPKE